MHFWEVRIIKKGDGAMKRVPIVALLLMWIGAMGCGDESPVSAPSEGMPAGKLTVSSRAVAGECNHPGCRPGFEQVSQGGDELTVDLPGGAQMTFVWIEPGMFPMGSPVSEPGRYDREGPQHEVTISRGFYLGKTEITQGQWEAVMGTTPWSGQDYVQSNPNHPAAYISWDDMQFFIGKLNAAGEEIYRLPSESEWEYACRAGTDTRWSFGDAESQLGDFAWYRDNAWDADLQYGQPVGTKLPNPWGLYDMHGNILEWCQDWYGDYSSSAQADPTGPETGTYRVLRGGYFYYFARSTRPAYRISSLPDFRDYYIGARLLRSK
jgi:formylglycine-generating enzyme required for sulfatase activity